MSSRPTTWDWDLSRTALDAPQERTIARSAGNQPVRNVPLTNLRWPADLSEVGPTSLLHEAYPDVRGSSSLAELLSSGEEFHASAVIERIEEIAICLSDVRSSYCEPRDTGDALNALVLRFLARAVQEGSTVAIPLQRAIEKAPLVGPGDAVGLARIVLVGDPKHPWATDILMPSHASSATFAHRARVCAELFLFGSLFRTFDKPTANAVSAVADAFVRQIEGDNAARVTTLMYLVDHPRRLADLRGYDAQQVDIELTVATTWSALL